MLETSCRSLAVWVVAAGALVAGAAHGQEGGAAALVGAYALEGDRGAGAARRYAGRARISLAGDALVVERRLDGQAPAVARGSARAGAQGTWVLRLEGEGGATTSGVAGALGGLLGEGAVATSGQGAGGELLLELKRLASGCVAARVRRGSTVLAHERLTPDGDGPLALALEAEAARFLPHHPGRPAVVRAVVTPAPARVDLEVEVRDAAGRVVWRERRPGVEDAGLGVEVRWDGRVEPRGWADVRRGPYALTVSAQRAGAQAGAGPQAGADPAARVTAGPVALEALPLIDAVWVVSRNGHAGDLTAAGKIVGHDDRPLVTAVVRAIVAGARPSEPTRTERAYFVLQATPPASHAELPRVGRVALAPWDAARWGALEARWEWVVALGLHDPAYRPTQNARRMTRNGEFTNVVSNGPEEGKWVGLDTLEYAHEPAGTGPEPRVDPRAGTTRYRVDVDYAAPALRLGEAAPGSLGRRDPTPTTAARASSGLEAAAIAPQLAGVSPEVHRISRKGASPEPYLAMLEAYRRVPWVYGSLGVQSQHFVGYDCADLAFAAARHAGLTTRTQFTNAHNMCELYARKPGIPTVRHDADGRLVDARRGTPVELLEGTGALDVRPGDLVFFDWDGDGKWDHTTILWSLPSGRFDLGARLAWAHHGPAVTDGFHVGPLEELVGTPARPEVRIAVRRWK